YLTAVLITRVLPSTFPFGTFTANILGCLIIGVVYGLAGRYGWLTGEWRVFLATGFCGGYTTFSSFTFENADLLQSGHYWQCSLNTIDSFIVGLVAVFAGILIATL